MKKDRQKTAATSTPDRFFNRRLAVIIAASFFFGVAMSIVKGNAADIRGAIGNICAPWLLLPFAASIYAKRDHTVQAAVVGFLASIVALIGFYFANSFVLSLGPYPWMVKVLRTLRTGAFYYKLSFISGPVFGAMGGLYVRYQTSIPALLMALLFVPEPLTWRFYDWGSFNSYPILSLAETVI